jgi:hypothetical protein
MKIEYGPPGAIGVTQLMSVGDAELIDIDLLPASDDGAKRAQWVGAAAWGAGYLLGSPALKWGGIGAALAGFLISRSR